MGPRLWGSAGAGSRSTSLECVEEHLCGTTCRCFAPIGRSDVAVWCQQEKLSSRVPFQAGEPDFRLTIHESISARGVK